MSASTADNKRIARRVPEEIATERKIDLVDEVFAEDAVEHGALGREAHGREEIREQLEEFLASFPDFEATVEEIVAEDDLVAMRVTLRGTHESPFLGIEPTGNSFEVENAVFTRVENGLIVERWLQPDTLSLLQQLDVVELPAMEA